MRYGLAIVLATGCVEYKEAETNATQGLTTTSEASSTNSGSTSTTGEVTASTHGETTHAATTTGATTTGATSSTSIGSTTETSTTGPACSGPCDPDNPPEGLSCTESCEYDFSEVPQFLCGGGCSPVGEPIGGGGCDQPDADMFCKLRTGNPRATADFFWDTKPAQPEAGFCCLTVAPEFGLGPIPLHGLDDLCYAPGDMSALPQHATASVIVSASLECMTP